MLNCVIKMTTCCAILGFAQESFAGNCHVGTYRLADSNIVDIASSDDGALRWRKFDGTTGELRVTPTGNWTSTLGWTGRPDGNIVRFGLCEKGKIRFSGIVGRRINFDVTETSFHSHDIDLVGRLILPKGRNRVPIVVLLHGAENTSALDSYSLQRLFPSEGVGAFVYDKRGTGVSGGKYTQDFDVLANDAVAAVHEARRLAGARADRVGFQGGSQGGWVAPLAATRTPVSFVIVSFGLAVTVIDEDQEEVALEMRLKGHNSAEIAKALEVADAAEAVIASEFTKGFERFDSVREKYRNETWYKDVHGNYTYLLLPYSRPELRDKGKEYVFGTPFRYDPMPTLRSVRAAQLWILGVDDLEAPSAETSERIKTLIAEKRPITLVLNPGAEHGMTEYDTRPDGERVSTRYAAGYFAMMVDFARNGSLERSYGASMITKPMPP